MSVFCALVAARLAPATGGIRINTLDQLSSCRPTGNSLLEHLNGTIHFIIDNISTSPGGSSVTKNPAPLRN